MCLKRANAKVSSIGCYPQVLALSAYSNLQVDHLSTTKPPDISNLTDLVHYGYSHHLYVLPLGCSPFSHLIYPNPNPNCDPNLTLTLTLTITNPNLNSTPTLTLTLTLHRVTEVRKWTGSVLLRRHVNSHVSSFANEYRISLYSDVNPEG